MVTRLGPEAAMAMIEAFMWGYWGWGGSTQELVEAFDAAEAQRGFDPPGVR